MKKVLILVISIVLFLPTFLQANIMSEGGKVESEITVRRYILSLEVRRYTEDDVMNLDIPVDKEFYDRVHIGQELSGDVFKFGMGVRVVVKGKRIE